MFAIESTELVKGAIITVDRSKRVPKYVISLADQPDVLPIKISANKFRSLRELEELVLAWVSLYR